MTPTRPTDKQLVDASRKLNILSVAMITAAMVVVYGTYRLWVHDEVAVYLTCMVVAVCFQTICGIERDKLKPLIEGIKNGRRDDY